VFAFSRYLLGRRTPLWGRIVSMLVLGLFYAVAEAVHVAMVIGQPPFPVFGRKQNEPLKRVGRQVSAYSYQILLFLTFDSFRSTCSRRGLAPASR